jgi:branched-chain amino acid transport system substrate-binding protein
MTLFKIALLALSLGLGGAAHAQAQAQAQPGQVKIALIEDLSGALATYAKAAVTGFELGLDYATNGTRTVGGRKITVVVRDSQGKPDVGKAQLTAAYADDKADLAVGATSSAVGLAMLPVAEEFKKVFLVEQAVADSLTSDKSNRYVFRSMRSSTQDAIANAAAIDKPGVTIATLAQDYAFGRDGVKAFKGFFKHAKIVHEEYVPINASDFTAPAQRLFDALGKQPGRKIIYVLWAPPGNPFKIIELDPKRYGIDVFGNLSYTLDALKSVKQYPGLEGTTYYYYGLPKNAVNDHLVAEHQKRFSSPPDSGTASGFTAAMAVVAALKKTGGDPGSEKLIAAMEGMEFDTPKGKMQFRKEDHQAMQSMYHVRIKINPALDWGVPELVDAITPDRMNVPLGRR